ncbi:hypothetical protein QJS10_CPB20g01761 [Acorus calamus]|uniref:Uncharacterized protein n=1 Tax=Acorus calamus TaxID=4465 RepID=A0AAV9C6Z7_ACOCL|nr:hypothetical protein QJS10_CPB20g01761 [Acorus calamus]
MAVFGQSDPPSSRAFEVSLTNTMKVLLGFLQSRFPLHNQPLPLLHVPPNQGHHFEARSCITYMKMFDTQVDAVRSTLNGAQRVTTLMLSE